MKINRLYLVMYLISCLSSYGNIFSQQKNISDPATEEILRLLKKGDIKIKVSPNIDFKDLMSVGSLLKDVNIGTGWQRDPNTGLWHYQEGIGEKIRNAVSDALVPLKEAGSSVISGFAQDLKDWKANLYKPATYEERIAQLRKIAYYGVLAAMIPTIGILMKRGAEAAIDIIKAKMLTPEPMILLPSAKYGRTDRLKRWWAGYKSPTIIFDFSVKERLEEIIEKTKNIKAHIRNGENITYDNLLLYGNPGTGKTLFAQILADYTDMDFLPVTAASLLQAGVEGIKYFDELLTMANNSKYGVIIFVDEADGLFVDRDSLDPASDHYKVLNHILAATGSGSNKFMLVAATNHAYVMDPAMGRRFQDRVLMPLPDESTRKELLVMYINEQLFNTKTRKPAFISAAQAILTQKKIDSIAQNTKGLSHAEIKDMVTIMGKKANATKDGIITPRNVETAVTEAIEKKQALERDELQKQRKAMQRQQHYMQPQPQMVNEPEIEGAPGA